MASTLSGTVSRSTDLVARYGGEEFAVLLADTDAHGARVVAELIRGRVEAGSIPHAGSQTARCVTVSVGLATAVPSADMEPMQLVEQADRALYQAKREGRNRVAAAEATAPF